MKRDIAICNSVFIYFSLQELTEELQASRTEVAASVGTVEKLRLQLLDEEQAFEQLHGEFSELKKAYNVLQPSLQQLSGKLKDSSAHVEVRRMGDT